MSFSKRLKRKIAPEEDSEEEDHFHQLAVQNKSRRATEMEQKNSRRGSVDTAHPNWAMDQVMKDDERMTRLELKAERLTKRRMSLSDIASYMTTGKVKPEIPTDEELKYGAGSSLKHRRRNSITEGMIERGQLDSKMSDADRGSRRMSFKEAAGRASVSRRSSIQGSRRGSVNEGPSDGRASVRVAKRGSFRDMNG